MQLSYVEAQARLLNSCSWVQRGCGALSINRQASHPLYLFYYFGYGQGRRHKKKIERGDGEA